MANIQLGHVDFKFEVLIHRAGRVVFISLNLLTSLQPESLSKINQVELY